VKYVSDSERKGRKMDAENVKEILGVVSSEVPALVKSLLATVFSEEAGKSMGKAAAAYYKELKDGGIPENVAVKMTEDYMKTFTSLGNMLRGGGRREETEWSGGVGSEIERRVREKLEKGQQQKQEDE
jgi:hypothetical protein